MSDKTGDSDWFLLFKYLTFIKFSLIIIFLLVILSLIISKSDFIVLLLSIIL